MYDVAIIGGGMAGMATAARLQAAGLATIVLEAHGQPGGCAGFYRRRGFSFDVGATTLVDFEPGGVGGELLETIGMPPINGEPLPGYQAWLPDRTVRLYRDRSAWIKERRKVFADSPAHQSFWKLLDRLANVFWQATRRGVKLPLRSLTDLTGACAALGWRNIHYGRFLNWTMGDALRSHGLRNDQSLVGLLAMLIEDTVHSTVDQAPLINSALGITIRGAGLSRASGGMRGFWQKFASHYRQIGGKLWVGCRVGKIAGSNGRFLIDTRRGIIQARQVVSAIPVELTTSLTRPAISRRLKRYLTRDAQARGGAGVVCLGVPEEEVAGQEFTHHQLMQDTSAPLGNGNNMFISVSAARDLESAPAGFRSVMISTHCDLQEWQELDAEAYHAKKTALGKRLVEFARRVYPNLATRPLVEEVGTPQTFERFTQRPLGAVGGVRLTLQNANQRAVPHDIGVPGLWLAGDTTWPGLGTVACVVSSRIVAEGVLRSARSGSRSKLISHSPARRSQYVFANDG